MIALLEVLNYRCLQYVHQELGPFHVLVGPNASGKSTFLDAIAFLGKFVTDGLDSAVGERTANFFDLVWQRGTEVKHFELAVEARLPGLDQMACLQQQGFETIRYEVSIGLNPQTQELQVLSEQVLLGKKNSAGEIPSGVPTSLMKSGREWKPLIAKYDSQETPRSIIVFPEIFTGKYGESSERGFLFPRKKNSSVLAALEESEFPASGWLSGVLGLARERINLDVHEMKKPCPPRQAVSLEGNGANLPLIVKDIIKDQTTIPIFKEWVSQWLAHLKTALPALEEIRVVERPEDRHSYLMVKYSNGMEVPSWMLSEGTLRMLALTIIPYVSWFGGVWLVEEPENGIHPLNLETVMQSLSSVYNGQVLVTTHSPAVLALTPVEKILVFENLEDQGVRIIPGHEHPRLKEWHGEPSISTLFASGVLG